MTSRPIAGGPLCHGFGQRRPFRKSSVRVAAPGTGLGLYLFFANSRRQAGRQAITASIHCSPRLLSNAGVLPLRSRG